MRSLRRLAAGALAVVLLAIPLLSVLFLTGCRKGSEMELQTNLAPDTRLTSAPRPFLSGELQGASLLEWDR